MKQRSLASHLAVWSFAFALVLKAAVPLMASWAAALQGKPIAEVCDVYGVATVPIPGTPSMASAASVSAHHHHHAGMSMAGTDAPAPAHHGNHDDRHGGDHCALSAVIALSTPGFGAYVAPLPVERSHTASPSPRAPAPADPAARWAALLGHGPPSVV